MGEVTWSAQPGCGRASTRSSRLHVLIGACIGTVRQLQSSTLPRAQDPPFSHACEASPPFPCLCNMPLTLSAPKVQVAPLTHALDPVAICSATLHAPLDSLASMFS